MVCRDPQGAPGLGAPCSRSSGQLGPSHQLGKEQGNWVALGQLCHQEPPWLEPSGPISVLGALPVAMRAPPGPAGQMCC